MNANLKNAAIGILMLGAASGTVAGIGYGINQGIKNKMETVTTDPMKAEQAIEKEGLFNKTMFEVKQKIGNLFSSKEETEPTQMINVNYDLSGICYQIAEYNKMNQEALKELDSLSAAGNPDATKLMEINAKLEKKYREIVQNLNDFNTNNPATNQTLEDLRKEVAEYEKAIKPIREKYKNDITNNK